MFNFNVGSFAGDDVIWDFFVKSRAVSSFLLLFDEISND